MKFEVTLEFEKSLKRLSKKYKSLKEDYIQFLDELENINDDFIRYLLQPYKKPAKT
jgi:mRNA-degrading endonuclease RelE of RelBE toxin-antitoxin system